MTRLCRLLKVSKSGYYAWRKRPLSNRKQYDLKLIAAIKSLHKGFRRAYGAKRLHHELKRQGLSCSRRRVGRLMKEAGIKASSVGLYAWRPGQHEFYAEAGNQLSKADKAERPRQQWVGDYTYIRTANGWLYFAVVIDLFSRKVVGFSFSSKRNRELTKSALRMALINHPPQKGCIFHSDQGIEYAAHEFRELIEEANMIRSMSRKGSPLDNAFAESFFHTLKAELVQRKVFKSKVEAVAQIVSYVEFYNRDRIHSGINYQSPVNYEKLCA